MSYVPEAMVGERDDTGTVLASEGEKKFIRITEYRGAHVNLRNSSGAELGTATDPLNVEGSITISSGTVSISGTVTVSATDLDIRNLAFATDKVDASGTTLGANSGVDIGDVTINNAAGASAVNIQDGGNSITVDGSVTVSGTVDTELTTADLDTGGGTDTRAVVGLVGSASGGGQLIPGSATDGLLVNLGANNDVTVTGTVAATQSGTWTEANSAAIKTAVETLDNAISGSEMQVDVVAALPAGDNNIGNVDIVTMPAVTQGTSPWVVSGTVTATPTGTQDINLIQVAGSSTGLAGSGVVGAATQRVTLATDVALPAGTNAIGKLAANSGVDIGDVDVTSVIPGTGATNLGKARDSAAGSTDTGIAVLFERTDGVTASAVADGEYEIPSLTGWREVRTRDQRAQDIDSCNATTGFTVLGNDTTNLAVSTNHVFGTGALTFDKVNGAANTVFAGIQKTITSISISEKFEDGGFVALGCYLPSLSNVVAVFIRLGTDSTNYNEWEFPVSGLTASQWMALRTPTNQPSGVTGNGWTTSAVTYVAFGVEFSSETNTLAGIIFDNVHFVQGRITDTSIDTTINSSVNTPNINIHRVGGSPTDTGAGAVSAGSQRIAIATGANGVVIGASASVGTGLSHARNTALTNTAVAIKASAGKLHGYNLYNPNASIAYVHFYDLAAASVVVGTTTPVRSVPLPSTATGTVGVEREFSLGINFATAMSMAATTTATGSTAPTTALVVNIEYI